MGYGQHELVWKVRRYIDEHDLLPRGEALVVGVSGGPDSLCLLHALRALAPDRGWTLHAAHMNHQLRGDESDRDARFVQALADEWGIPCTVEACDVQAAARRDKLAIEEAARQCRYGFLARLAAQVGASRIAVGHNADDQAESVLMHLLRGSGLAGLRGMLPKTELSGLRLNASCSPIRDPQPAIRNLCLVRPLLGTGRVEIEAYCRQHHLEPRFDRSNLDTTYFRNWLRHTLLPLMESHNPDVSEVLCRTASVIAADYELLHGMLEQAWDQVVQAESEQAITFNLSAWRALPLALQRSTLREAIHRLRHTLRNINFVHVQNALEVATRGPAGQQATLPAGLMLSVGYDSLLIAGEGYTAPLPDQPYLEPGSAIELGTPLPSGTHIPLPGSPWAIELDYLEPETLKPETASPWEAYLDADALESPLVLRTRRPGDRLAPLGMGGHTKALRDVFIHAKVPQAWRAHVPLLVSGSRVVWVCGVCASHEARLTPLTRRVLRARFVRA
ncbi:MAG: tRNA lysidine(34) synthetase TilS [Thermoflexales bacterium]|nr:tRNA lysidine(34) synthetase TilS [Thermoflexales bacterium]